MPVRDDFIVASMDEKHRDVVDVLQGGDGIKGVIDEKVHKPVAHCLGQGIGSELVQCDFTMRREGPFNKDGSDSLAWHVGECAERVIAAQTLPEDDNALLVDVRPGSQMREGCYAIFMHTPRCRGSARTSVATVIEEKDVVSMTRQPFHVAQMARDILGIAVEVGDGSVAFPEGGNEPSIQDRAVGAGKSHFFIRQPVLFRAGIADLVGTVEIEPFHAPGQYRH